MSVEFTALQTAGEHSLRLHRLTYVPEGEEVMVGRPDTGSYAVFPPEGAELLKRLDAGWSLADGARWWYAGTGAQLDTVDFLATIEALGFTVADDEVAAPVVPVRWQRLGAVLFSRPVLAAYATVVVVAAVAMILDPTLRPSYRHFFFTEHIALIPIALALGQFPLLLLHEAFHALAARRLGLPSTLGIGRRYYYLVAETRLDSLYSVPRRDRYLPFFAGALVDLVGVGVFTLAAVIGRQAETPAWLTGLALAFATSGVLRVVWQGMFYLETDFYFAINTVSGCTDLHGAASHLLRTRLARLRRRPLDPKWGQADDWSDHDRAAARWYSSLMVAGYGLSTLTLLVVALPAAWRFWTTVFDRLVGPEQLDLVTALDTSVFVALSLGQLGLLSYVTIRDRRKRAADQSSNHTHPDSEEQS
ncbi:MAG: hypothetical protein ACRCYU_11080 [Nocardioides sp.]